MLTTLREEEAGDVLSLFSANKNTKFVETTIYTELFTSHRRKPDKHSTSQGSLSRHQSTYTELFHMAQTKARQVLGKSRKFVKYNDLHTASGLYNADENQNR